MTDISELRGKSPDELKEMAQSLKKELFNLRFQQATGEFSNHSRFRLVRRDIARVKTLLNEPKDGAVKVKAAKLAKAKKAETKAAAPEAKAAKKPAKKKASGE